MMTGLRYLLFDTVRGACGVVWGPGGIRGVQLPERNRKATAARLRREHPGVLPAEDGEPVPEVVATAIPRIQALMAGTRSEDGSLDDLVSIPLDYDGLSEFSRRVYDLTRAIPPGRTRTYGELARELGDVHLARAVGQALGHNPFAPVVPCHRVVAAGGASGGFSAAGGVDTKLHMLETEGARIGQHPGLFDDAPVQATNDSVPP